MPKPPTRLKSKGRRTRALARAAGRRSKFEMDVEAALNALLGREVEYESTRLDYIRKARYVPDFKDGEVLYEAKGRFLPSDRTKLLAVKQAYPRVDLRLVFQRNNKLSKDSTTTYMDWAKQHGFPASVYPDLPVGDLCTPPSENTPEPRSGILRKKTPESGPRAGGNKRCCSSTSKRRRT